MSFQEWSLCIFLWSCHHAFLIGAQWKSGGVHLTEGRAPQLCHSHLQDLCCGRGHVQMRFASSQSDPHDPWLDQPSPHACGFLENDAFLCKDTTTLLGKASCPEDVHGLGIKTADVCRVHFQLLASSMEFQVSFRSEMPATARMMTWLRSMAELMMRKPVFCVDRAAAAFRSLSFNNFNDRHDDVLVPASCTSTAIKRDKWVKIHTANKSYCFTASYKCLACWS